MTRKFLACTVSAAALSLGVASVAMAATTTTLNGGGSTLAQPTYDSEFTTYSSATPSTLFSYDGVGSGAGQTAFLNNDITQFNSPSNQYGTIVGTTVHFGASDAVLSSTQISGYTLAATDGPLIQIPMIGVAISIPYVNAGLKTALVLTDSQLCGVLSGKLTNWSQISSKATPGTIEVVYRSDSSGTTFLLTQHLNAVCTSSNSSFPVLPVAVTKTFASLFTNSTPPSNFIGESGSAAVASEMVATPLSFGYLSPDYTSIAPKSANTTSLKVASLTNATNNTSYQPSVANTELGLENPGAGSTNPNPPANATNAANPSLWVPLIPVTTKGYPLVGYTTWDFSSCYAVPAAGSDIVAFLNKHFSNASYKTIITNNGFAPLSNTGATKFVTAITNDFLSNTSGYNLNVNNATLCKGKAGR
jgi:ABC-type phosphate transport system substrate-binding protein